MNKIKIVLTTIFSLGCVVANATLINTTPSTNLVKSTGQPIFSPYKDVGTSMNWWDPAPEGPNTYVMSTLLTSTGIVTEVQPLVKALPSNVNTVTWAFATGDCSNENWAGVPYDKDAHGIDAFKKNIKSFVDAGKNYIISTGGAAGIFTCSDSDAMKAFIDRYNSSNLVGLDIDIEGHTMTHEQITSLITTLNDAKKAYPTLRISFTLATLADSSGSKNSLNPEGVFVIETANKMEMLKTNFVVNLMAMDYGDGPNSNICVIKSEGDLTLCDMGKSAIQAVENLHDVYNIPYNRIEVTPLIGINDIADEVFTLDDAKVVAQYAKDNALAGFHYWSYDRDTSCVAPNTNLQTTCNNDPLAGISELSYTKITAPYFQ